MAVLVLRAAPARALRVSLRRQLPDPASTNVKYTKPLCDIETQVARHRRQFTRVHERVIQPSVGLENSDRRHPYVNATISDLVPARDRQRSDLRSKSSRVSMIGDVVAREDREPIADEEGSTRPGSVLV